MDNFGCALEKARTDAEDLGLDNVDYVAEDAADPGVGERFKGRLDYVTAFDSIHDQTRPLGALKNVRTMVAPGVSFPWWTLMRQQIPGGTWITPWPRFFTRSA